MQRVLDAAAPASRVNARGSFSTARRQIVDLPCVGAVNRTWILAVNAQSRRIRGAVADIPQPAIARRVEKTIARSRQSRQNARREGRVATGDGVGLVAQQFHGGDAHRDDPLDGERLGQVATLQEANPAVAAAHCRLVLVEQIVVQQLRKGRVHTDGGVKELDLQAARPVLQTAELRGHRGRVTRGLGGGLR